MSFPVFNFSSNLESEEFSKNDNEKERKRESDLSLFLSLFYLLLINRIGYEAWREIVRDIDSTIDV